MNNQREFQQKMQIGSGLTRYRSAPSSYFSTLLNSNIMGDDGFGEDEFEHLLNPRASCPETQKFFSRFMNTSETIQQNCSFDTNLQSQLNTQYPPPRKRESSVHKPRQQLQRQQSNDFSSVSHMMSQIMNSGAANSDMQDSNYGLMGPMNSNSAVQMKTEEGGGGASLIRHRSSPAGLLENINIKNELGAASLNQVDYKTIENIHGEDRFGENSDKDGGYSSVFPINYWDDSVILPDNFFKGLTNYHQGTEGESEHTISKLSHHLSLPKSSAQLLTMEKVMQDAVPCKIRAKRGFATHPRSIAERVRRTKISERMRKLQDLVPNMEKQTNTADMLDLAVDYIKDLQRQVKTLSDNRSKCSCSARQKP